MTGSCQNAFSITPSDTTDLPTPTRAIYIGVLNGNLKVTMLDGTIITFMGIKAGVIYPFAVRKVFANGTTVTNLVGLY